jgi:myo-inositol catabolism protein IolC
MPRGDTRDLYFEPFDHRGSCQTNMFGWKGMLTEAQTGEIAAAKRVIYDGFKTAIAGGAPSETRGILLDEQIGAAILRDAKAAGFTTACRAEKSSQEEFNFEYGENFTRHIEAFDPSFSKVLVRYNPEGNRALDQEQAARLRCGLHRICRRAHRVLAAAGRLAGGENDARTGGCRNRRQVRQIRRHLREIQIYDRRSVKGPACAIRNDRPWPDGSKHGAPAVAQRPSMRGI